MKKILINIYGASGAGKTHLAMALAQALAKQFRDVAYVPEYATHLIESGHAEVLKDQKATTGGQAKWLRAAFVTAKIVVTDSPCALGYIYFTNPADLPDVRRIVEESEAGLHIINIMVWHTDESLREYSMEGRIHGMMESLANQDKICIMLTGGLPLTGTLDGKPYTFTPEPKSRIPFRRGEDIDALAQRIIKDFPRAD